MSEKLHQKYQDPKVKFFADWTWRILALVGVGFLSYAQLWGDGRYVTREEFPQELSNLVESVMTKIEPRLSSLETHAADPKSHPSFSDSEAYFVSRREYESTIKWIQSALIRIGNPLKGSDAKFKEMKSAKEI